MDPNSQLEVALEVERHGCPTCGASAGSPCRTRGGNTAFRYHTARFVMVPTLGCVDEVIVPGDRLPGQPWRASVGIAVADKQDSGGFRIGYAYCSLASEDRLEGQLELLDAAGCDQIFRERVSVSVKQRPELEHALRAALEAKQSGFAGSVSLVATGLDRVARSSDELISVSAALRTHSIRLELLGGMLAGTFDPHGVGSLLFSVLEAAAQLDRDHLRNKKVEGQRTAAGKGKTPGRPRLFDAEMVARARQLRDEGVAVAEIAERLVIATGRNAGGHPSVASVYRALAEGEGSEPTSAVVRQKRLGSMEG